MKNNYPAYMYPEPILRTRESQRRSLSVRFSLPLPSAKREQDTILNTTTIVSSEADMKPEIEEEASSFEDVAPSYKVIILTSPEVEQSNIQLNSTTPEVGIVSEMENSREDKAQVIYHDDLKYEIENENIDNYNEQKVIDRNDHVNTETYVVEDPSSAFANRRSREYHEKTCGDLETHKRQKLEFDFCKETTRLRDIIGHAAVKLRIEEIILPLGLPFEVADSVLKGIRSIPVSILLHGPPGCGKTKLAKAIAGEAQAGFMSVAPSDVLSKFVGESEASVRNIFRKALDLALQLESKCTVVFFDEIDALGQSRENRGGGEGEGCSRRVLAELLLQLNLISDPNHRLTREQEFENGNCSSENVRTRAEARVIVVAATNRVLDCDEALKRRFGIQLEVGLPNRRDRKKMIIRHMSEIEHTIVEEELEYLSLRTDSWSGSDIESLVREAAMAPVRECIRAAAHLRKRASRLEQRGGDSPVQGGCHPDEPDPDTEARSLLLHGFQTLRPVTVHDFDHGIFLFTGQNMFNPGPYDFHSSMHGREKEYYDSSSEED